MANDASMSMQEWCEGLKFTKDADGGEMLLDKDGGQVSRTPVRCHVACHGYNRDCIAKVMMEWERPYMVACVNALKIDDTCDVLEVKHNCDDPFCHGDARQRLTPLSTQIGFGCAYSAERIQYHKPRYHPPPTLHPTPS